MRGAPVLAQDEGVEGDDGEEHGVLVGRQRDRRQQAARAAHDRRQRLRLRRQGRAQHHQVPWHKCRGVPPVMHAPEHGEASSCRSLVCVSW